jgi:hypothetical protein
MRAGTQADGLRICKAIDIAAEPVGHFGGDHCRTGRQAPQVEGQAVEQEFKPVGVAGRLREFGCDMVRRIRVSGIETDRRAGEAFQRFNYRRAVGTAAVLEHEHKPSRAGPRRTGPRSSDRHRAVRPAAMPGSCGRN